MDVEPVLKKNINMSISFIDLDDVALDFKSVKNEAFKQKLHSSFRKLKDAPNGEERVETFDEVGSIINFALDPRQIRVCLLETIGKTISPPRTGREVKLLLI